MRTSDGQHGASTLSAIFATLDFGVAALPRASAGHDPPVRCLVVHCAVLGARMCQCAAIGHQPVTLLWSTHSATHRRTQRTPELLAPAGGPDALRRGDRQRRRRGLSRRRPAQRPPRRRELHARDARRDVPLRAPAGRARLPDRERRRPAERDGRGARARRSGLGGGRRRGHRAGPRAAARCCARALPHVRVHASTQINAHNTPTVDALDALGVSRVTLAREVSVDEIAALVAAGGGRGRVVRPRRAVRLLLGPVPDVVADRRAQREPRACARSRAACPTSWSTGRATCSPTPGRAPALAEGPRRASRVLPALVAAGVAALKIEGRMKSPEYVALVTGVYRAALDRAAADPGRLRGPRRRAGRARRGVLPRLHRGVPARRARQRDDELPAAQQPRRARRPRRGRRDRRARRSRSRRQLDAEDTIEFWTSSGRFAQAAGPLAFDGAEHPTAPAGVACDDRDRAQRARRATASSACATPRCIAAARRTFERPQRAGARAARLRGRACVVGEPLRVRVARRTRAHRCGARARSSSPRAPRPSPPRRSSSTSAGSAARRIASARSTSSSRRGRRRVLGAARVRREALEALRGACCCAVERPRARRGPTRATARAAARRKDARRRRRGGRERRASRSRASSAGADAAHVPAHRARRRRAVAEGVVPLLPRVAPRPRGRAALRFALERARPSSSGNLGMLAAGRRARARRSRPTGRSTR